MATDTKFNMPVLTKSKPYKRYKTELSLWKSITSVPASKIGPMIALSLPEDHESKIKDKVFDKMNMTSLMLLSQNRGAACAHPAPPLQCNEWRRARGAHEALDARSVIEALVL